jgi:hypothetical protein
MIDFNVGKWNWGLPKIRFMALDSNGQTNMNPIICLYRMTGGDPSQNAISYPWWIENSFMDGKPNHGTLLFRSSSESPWSSTIGMEAVTTRVAFQQNGNIGINNDVPTAGFQVTNSNVIFDGDEDQDDGGVDTDQIPSGAGTRFMWIPERKALRAGGVEDNQWGNYSTYWNEDYLGNYSVALGKNCKAKGLSFAFGEACEAFDFHTIAIGHASRAEAGRDDPNYNGDAIAIGHQAWAKGFRTLALGTYVRADSEYTCAIGNHVSTNIKKGSTIFGDGTRTGESYNNCTNSSNINEITMRYVGNPDNDSTTANPCYRFMTWVNEDDSWIGVELHRGSNYWYASSDRNMKEILDTLDDEELLNHIRNVPITVWRWKNDSTYRDSTKMYHTSSYHFIGPMAQDFYREFPYGVPDSTKLSMGNLAGVSFQGVQALKKITDNILEIVQQQQAKSEELDQKTDSALTKAEFQKFKDTFNCYLDACERIDSLEKKTERLVTQSEFISFKDSIRCYADACTKIEQLEKDNEDLKSIIEELKERIEALESKDSSRIKEKDDDNIQEYGLHPSQSEFDDIILNQNNPNPFAETTEINYYIPVRYKGQAQLIIANENGDKKYQEYAACIGKPCQLKISAKELKTGVYLYAILLNNKIVKINKMMIIK